VPAGAVEPPAGNLRHLVRLRHLAFLLALSACGGRSELGATTSTSAGTGTQPPSCGAPWVLFTLFSNGGSQIYARRADGSESHPLALPEKDPIYPSVSPDGTMLLYAHDATTGLTIYRFADASYHKLATQGEVGRGSVSPDGSLVVYGNGSSIRLVGVDGSPSDHELVSGAVAPGGSAGFPSFTGDSQSVIYAALGVVASIGVDGSGSATLLNADTQNIAFPNPTLSPDASSLAAIVACDGASVALRTYPLSALPEPCSAGAVVTTIDQTLSYYSPSWGPTGLIAYSLGAGMFVVDAAGGTPTNLTADLGGPTIGVDAPTWAPSCAALP
jgi:Tol biopolymer transport system component